MTDFPKPPEMGHPIDVPPAQPPAPDLSSELPIGGEISTANDITRPTLGATAVPGHAELNLGETGDAQPDITRPANPVLESQGGSEAHDPPGAAAAEVADEVGLGETPARDAGDPPDQPPPGTDVPSSGEFPSDETVLDMPEQEREAFAAELEKFASGGERYSEPYTVAGEDGVRSETDQGYRRNVPPRLLDAHGVGYESVEVATLEATDNEPYKVGLTANRVVEVEMEPPGADSDPAVSRAVEGDEMKGVIFTAESLDPALAPVWTMEAESGLLAPREGEIAATAGHPDDPVEVRITRDITGPAMTLREARALATAVAAANALPPDAPEFTEEYTPPHKAPYPDLPPAEFPEGGEAFTDLTQDQRRQLVNEIDGYARAGGTTMPQRRGNILRYERQIPTEILQRHGIDGEVTAVVQEGTNYPHHRYVLNTSEPVSRVVDGYEAEGALPGKQEGSLALFEVGGVRDGTHGHYRSTDQTAGYRDVHVEHGGGTRHWLPGEAEPAPSGPQIRGGAPDITYDEVRRIRNALSDAFQADQ
jgi:hypothetical protein